MASLVKGIVDQIKKSVLDHTGKSSHTRISSYFILATIMLNSMAFMVLEIVNAIIMWKQNLTYIVPAEHIWIFGLILSHHLGLLFYKQKSFSGKNEFVAQSNVEEVKSGTEAVKEEPIVAEETSSEETSA